MRVAALCATSDQNVSRETPAHTGNTANPSPPNGEETPKNGCHSLCVYVERVSLTVRRGAQRFPLRLPLRTRCIAPRVQAQALYGHGNA